MRFLPWILLALLMCACFEAPQSSEDTTSTDTQEDTQLADTSTDALDTEEDTGPALCGGEVCASGTVCCSDRCVDLDTEDDHCGSCDTACLSGQSCDVGSCLCSSGFADCNIDGDCETDLDTSLASCGACGNACLSDEGSCVAGACQCDVLEVISASPDALSVVSRTEVISVSLGCRVSLAEPVNGFAVLGQAGARYNGTYAQDDAGVVTFTPDAPGYLPGDVLTVVLSPELESMSGITLSTPGNWQLRVAQAGGGLGYSATPLADTSKVLDVALGDIDGDGLRDAVIASAGGVFVFFNDGAGSFGAGESLSSSSASSVALGDLNGDGALDAFIARRGAANLVALGAGGRFRSRRRGLAPRASTWTWRLAT